MLEDLFGDVVLVKTLEVCYKVGEVVSPPGLDRVGEGYITKLVFIVEGANGAGRGRTGGDMMMGWGL